MGETAEKLVDKYGITREETDRYAMETQRRCQAAREAGRFADEIVPIEVPGRKGVVQVLEVDEHPRERRDDGKPRKSEAGFPEGWNGACR